MPIKLLHLDDDVRQTELLRLMLKKEDYQVISVNDPESALRLARDERPDIMLLDINIPHMNGVEIAASVKLIPEISNTPMIALTANAMYGDREYYLSNNFVAYLAKPVLRFELLRVLQSVIPPKSDSDTPTDDTNNGN